MTECRDKSKVIEFSGILGLSRFWCEKKITDLICEPISTSLKFSAETKMEDTKLLVGELSYFNIELKHYKLHYSEYRAVSIPMQRTKSTIYPWRMFFQQKLLIETFLKEMKPVVMSDKWGWVWISRKNIIKCFFWNFRTIVIVIQQSKSAVFHLSTPLQVLCFRLRAWCKNSNL